MSILSNWFSQTRDVQDRKARHLHPINEVQRFHVLVCCFFCSCTVSITYAFDMFTTNLQDQFGLSSGDLTTVSTVGLVFCYFTIPYGFIYEAMGPFVLFMVCFFSGGLGALLMALAFAGKVKGDTATFSVYYAFLNLCSGLIDVAYITTLAEMFPRNRGPVIALVKVMTSLGSSALACICVNLFNSNIIGYIYFLMALVMTMSLWGAFVVVLPPYYMNWWRRRGKTPEQIAELESLKPYYEKKFVPKRRLILGYIIIAVLIIFFAVEAPVVAYTKDVTRGGQVAVGVVCVALVCSIVVIALPIRCLGGVNEPEPIEETGEVASASSGGENKLPQEQPENEDNSGALFNAQIEAGECAHTEPAATADADAPAAVYEGRQDPRYPGTMKDYLLGIDLWLIFGMTMFSGVIGTLVSYNSSTISIAINGYARSTELSALYTAFLGVGSSVGRISFGAFEAYVQSQKPGHRKVTITMALPVSSIIATIAGILLLTVPGKVILLPYILVYFENGWSAAVNALIFPCLFENCHNSLYNCSFFVTCVCIICFNRLMFGIYTDKKHDEYGYARGESCKQRGCIQMPLIVGTCTAAAASLFAIAVHVRYTRFLRRHREAAGMLSSSGSLEEIQDYIVPQKAISPIEADVDHADPSDSN